MKAISANGYEAVMPFISKFALKQGIIEVPADKVDADGTYMHNSSGKAGWGTYVGKPHIHATIEAAIAKGEKMRAAKIKSHEEAIASLRAMKI